MKIAVLDDYAGRSAVFADWSRVKAKASVEIFEEAIPLEDAARVLAPFDAVCLIRERMPMPRSLIEKLPNLKLIMTTGGPTHTLDAKAASERGITVCYSEMHPGSPSGAPEVTWGLVMSSVRHIPQENQRLHEGKWQRHYSFALHGSTLGVLGLGRMGKRVANYGKAFGMSVIAWSQNLTAEAAAEAGVTRVEKNELFAKSDVITIHLKLSERTIGMVGARELGLMKPHAHIINTARGPIIDEAALIDALRNKKIGGAGLDVFNQEPLPVDHPLRELDNVVLTPHIGYAMESSLRDFYTDTVEGLEAYLNGKPIGILTADTFRR